MKITTNYSVPNFKGLTVDVPSSDILRERFKNPNKDISEEAHEAYNGLRYLSDAAADIYVKYDEENDEYIVKETMMPGQTVLGTLISSGDDLVETMQEAIRILSGDGYIKVDTKYKN